MAIVKQQTISTGPFSTHLHRAGEGHAESILFLHGSGPGADGWSNWQFALPEFGEAYDALAPDLIGFGASTHPSPPPTSIRAWMRCWVDQCIALLDKLGKEKVHLVGNSMGGALALHLLIEAPQRFESVVLMGPVGAPCTLTPALDRLWGFHEDPTYTNLREAIRWFVYDESFIREKLEDITRMRLQAAMRPEVRRSFEAMFPPPRQRILDALVVPESSLQRMEHPTLLIHGRDDRIVPVETSLHLVRHLPRVQLHMLGQCSHWTQIEYKETFHQLLWDFFGGKL